MGARAPALTAQGLNRAVATGFMRPRRSWLIAAAGIVVAAGLGLAIARVSGLILGPASPGDVALSYRLTDLPVSMPASQAREIAMRVIARRLASHRLVNRVDPGAPADVIQVPP